MILFAIYRALFSKEDDARFYIFTGIWSDQIDAVATGEIASWQSKTKEEKTTYTLILKKVTIQITGQETKYPLEYLVVYLDSLQVGEAVCEQLLPGNVIRVNGNLQEIATPSNPGEFNAREYYKEKRIYYQMSGNTLQRLQSSCQRYQSLLYRLRQRINKVYTTLLDDKEAGILCSMITGDKSMMDLDMQALYQANGIGHILAISGLHISILSMALYQFLRFLRLPDSICIPITLFILFSYGLMTDYGISTSRAVVMVVLMLLARLLGRSYDLPTAAATSALIILVQKPFALKSTSFLLSFGAIVGIYLFYPVLIHFLVGPPEVLHQRKKKDHRREKELRASRTGWIQWYGFLFLRKTGSLLLVSCSVQLLLLPFTLYFFYQFPIYSILLNLLVVPLASLLVILGFLGGILGSFCLAMAIPFLWGAHAILKIYECLCHFFEKLPLHMLITGCPSVQKLMVYFGFLILALWVHFRFREKKLSIPAVLLLLVPVLILLVPNSKKDFRITFLDVGQGDCIYFQSDSGTTFLLDGGSSTVSQVGKRRILPYLKYHGIAKLDYMIMTHPDADHMNGLLELLQASESEGFTVGHLLLPNAMQKEDNYQSLLQAAKEKSVPVIYWNTGDSCQSKDLSLQCLHPAKGFQDESTNAGSITLLLKARGFQFLLTGDLEGAGEEAVMKGLTQTMERIDVLKVAHHGSKNSTSTDFLALIHPKVGIISCGKKNRYGHPHQELMNRLYAQKINVMQTKTLGAISFQVKKEQLVSNHFRKQ